MPYEGLLYALLLTSSIMVLFDAKALGAKRGGLGGGFLDMGYVGWFVACLLFWGLAFPCYLIKRPRLVWAKAQRETRWPAVFAAPAPAAQRYTREYAQAYWLPWTEPIAPPGPISPATTTNVPSSRGVQLAGMLTIVAVIGICVCAGLQGERASATDTAGNFAPATTSTPARPSVPDLAQITLRSTDFHNGYRVRPAAGGDQLTGHATLDNCGFRFTTETARVARREVYVVDGSGQDTGLGNEVVRYRSNADAALALNEWRSAAAHCPRTPVRSSSTGTARLTERVTRIEQRVSGLPVAANVLTIETITVNHQGRLHLIAVLQVRGSVLDALYVAQSRTPTVRELRGIVVVAAGTGQRLAAQ